MTKKCLLAFVGMAVAFDTVCCIANINPIVVLASILILVQVYVVVPEITHTSIVMSISIDLCFLFFLRLTEAMPQEQRPKVLELISKMHSDEDLERAGLSSALGKPCCGGRPHAKDPRRSPGARRQHKLSNIFLTGFSACTSDYEPQERAREQSSLESARASAKLFSADASAHERTKAEALLAWAVAVACNGTQSVGTGPAGR